MHEIYALYKTILLIKTMLTSASDIYLIKTTRKGFKEFLCGHCKSYLNGEIPPNWLTLKNLYRTFEKFYGHKFIFLC